MQQWADIRRRVLTEGVSKRQILGETGMHWTTLEKILSHSRPPGYRAKKVRERPKIGPLLLIKPSYCIHAGDSFALAVGLKRRRNVDPRRRNVA